jgi:UDP-N-acetylmuramoyl-tripeptide--D-alanyl-D-alanine ligase
MTAAILRAQFTDGDVLATSGNLNNAIGLPLTILGLRAAHRAAVIEIGMNHAGETAELAAIAQPTIALINNAQREHQEFMKSVADVAAEHAALLNALPDRGVAVINADDDYATFWRDVISRRTADGAMLTVRDFGLRAPAAVTARYRVEAWGAVVDVTAPEGSVMLELKAPGRHNVSNALGAIAAATAAGASLAAAAAGLAAFRPLAGRLRATTLAGGATVIDDSYNANPDSLRAAIAVLARSPAPRWLVLGDMGEVGDQGAAFHSEVGDYARAAGIERLLSVGKLARHAAAAFGPGGEHFAEVDALADAVRATLAPGMTVLVKGSRFMRMERVVAVLAGAAAECSDALALATGRSRCAHVQRVQLHHVARRAGNNDRAGHLVRRRTADDQETRRVQDRPGGARRWAADAPHQGRDADDGRRADPGVDRGHDAAVGRSAQPLHLGCADRDSGIRRDRLGRRLPARSCTAIPRGLSARTKLLLQSLIGLVAAIYLAFSVSAPSNARNSCSSSSPGSPAASTLTFRRE